MMLLNSLQKSHEFYQFFQINHAKEAFYDFVGTPQHILCCKHIFFTFSTSHFSENAEIFYSKMLHH